MWRGRVQWWEGGAAPGAEEGSRLVLLWAWACLAGAESSNRSSGPELCSAAACP
jgi:hypothetical protein